jgi:zinc protease
MKTLFSRSIRPLTVGLALLAGSASAVLADALPTDPALVTGTLPNGLRYIIRQHANPPERAAVWMHVSSGSLNETDEQRGIAHYLEHMAFNGSKNFPPGTVVKFFEDLGLTFGRHQNAFTSFDQTTYQLALPDNKTENFEKAMKFMGDVAFGLLLDPKEIEEERQIIMEEKRSRLSPQQRVQDIILKRIAPGSLFGERLPIGVEETILGVKRDDFVAYWEKFYTPGNITVTVVADKDPAIVRQQIEATFGGAPAKATAADADPKITPTASDSAIVVTDPELQRAEVSFNRLRAPKAPTTTISQYREDMVDLIGTWALNQRLARKLEQGGMSFINANVEDSNLFRSVRWTSGSVTTEPAKWANAFRELATEVQRARLHGFDQREIDRARSELLSNAETAAKREGTFPAQALLRQYNGQIADGEPIMSPTQNLEILKGLLPSITVAEVSARFKDNFDPSALVFVAELPESGSVPTEAELLAFGRSAMNVTPAAETQAEAITSLLDKMPAPGAASEIVRHEASGVTSATLPSGARVHHRFIDIQKDTVTITISLAAGSIDETAATRGVSEAAALAWQRPASSTRSSTQIREFMSGKSVNVGGGAGSDTMTLTVSGSPKDLATGLQLAHLLLTDPKVEPASFDQWQTAQLQAIAQRGTLPQGVFSEMIPEAIFPKGEMRPRPLTAEQVKAVTLAAAQARISEVVRTAPMEISVVGDITLEAAMPMVEQFLGSLPSRAVISARTNDEKRTLQRPVGPITVERTLATKTPMAMVLSGFYNADAEDLANSRRMTMASRILSMRMNKVIREEKQLVYSIGAGSSPGTVYPGFGVFQAAAPTEEAKAGELAKTINAMYDEFLASGPTAEEVDTARRQLFNTLDEQMKDPGFWTSQLATMTYRNRSMDDLMGLRDFYAAMTASDIHAAYKRFCTPENRMTIVLRPAAPEKK